MKVRAKHKLSLVMFSTLIVGIVLCSLIGATLAYFQVEKDVAGNFQFGFVGASWCNGTNTLTDDAEYVLNLGNSPLVRGDANGVNLLQSDQTTTGGYLNVRADNNSQEQYLRVKITATVDYNDEEVDVSEYLTFRFDLSGAWYTVGSTNFWPKSGDYYYYYIFDGINTINVLSSSQQAFLCSNIVLSGSFPTKYLSCSQINVSFEFETLQKANDVISSAWGQTAVTALHL